MYSQIDIRYKVSDTVNIVRSLTNAFPGDVTLCLENRKLYQYVEYAAGSTIPADDGVLFLQTTDLLLNSRWVAIEAYSDKCFCGTFTENDWSLESGEEKFTYVINLPQGVKHAKVFLFDETGNEVFPENTQYVETAGFITSVIITVGAIPACNFNGKYRLTFEGLN